MSELRKETTAAHRPIRGRVQRLGLVQDRQPPRGEERDEVGDQVREQVGNEIGNEVGDQVRNQSKAKGPKLSEERGVILAGAVGRGRAVIQSFAEDDCPFYAGAVAYQIFFALDRKSVV